MPVTITNNGRTYQLGPFADLPSACLNGANLNSADLSHANLSDADLRGANLNGAKLSHANLNGANLSCADLYGADLSAADLTAASLYGADLTCASLRQVKAYGANFYSADFRGADLDHAKMAGANLRDACLDGAVNIPASLAAELLIVPTDGDVIGWKKARSYRGEDVIVKLRIPAGAKRGNATGRKCRAEYAEVLEIIGADVAYSTWDFDFAYRAGETVRPEWPYDENRWHECASGIHFFITREEAECY